VLPVGKLDRIACPRYLPAACMVDRLALPQGRAEALPRYHLACGPRDRPSCSSPPAPGVSKPQQRRLTQEETVAASAESVHCVKQPKVLGCFGPSREPPGKAY